MLQRGGNRTLCLGGTYSYYVIFVFSKHRAENGLYLPFSGIPLKKKKKMEMLTEQKLLCGMSLFKTIVTELRTMRKYFICKENIHEPSQSVI